MLLYIFIDSKIKSNGKDIGSLRSTRLLLGPKQQMFELRRVGED